MSRLSQIIQIGPSSPTTGCLDNILIIYWCLLCWPLSVYDNVWSDVLLQWRVRVVFTHTWGNGTLHLAKTSFYKSIYPNSASCLHASNMQTIVFTTCFLVCGHGGLKCKAGNEETWRCSLVMPIKGQRAVCLLALLDMEAQKHLWQAETHCLRGRTFQQQLPSHFG